MSTADEEREPLEEGEAPTPHSRSSPASEVGLAAVRRRGVAVLSLAAWAAAIAFLLVSASSLTLILHQGLAVIDDLRRSAGLLPPASGPDWLLLGVLSAAVLAAISVLVLAWTAYRRAWARRLAAVWPERRERRKFARRRPLAAVASERERAARNERLRALLASPAWSGEDAADEKSGDAEASYEASAQGLLARLEPEIAERAIGTGLVIGVSSHRWLDALTIVAAALEIQLHVATRLGLRPSFALWRELIRRAGASLFVNSYLNRQDAMAVSFAIKKTAMGLQAASEMMEEGRDLLHEVDAEEILDSLLGDGVLPDALRPVVSASVVGAGLGLGVGRTGLHLVGQAVEKIGDDLLQGVLAGGVLYFHGMALAAECLALDERHRNSPAMTRTFLDCVKAVGSAAGGILKEQIGARKEAFRERRKAAVSQSKNLAGKALRKLKVWP